MLIKLNIYLRKSYAYIKATQVKRAELPRVQQAIDIDANIVQVLQPMGIGL